MSARFPRANPFSMIVPLAEVSLRTEVVTVRRRYESEFGVAPDDQGGWYHEADWHRISFVLDALRSGGRFLDVGVGAGQFINAVAATGAYEEVHGVDPSRFKKYLEFGGPIVRGNASVGDLPFPDDHFDVVTCMEVLEHVPDEVLVSGLAELRRVCAGQLIMSVPFEEPEPIYDGHCRRFTGADVAHHFPDATRVLLFRSLAPWAVVEEWCGTAEKSPSDASLEQAAGRHGSSLGVVRATRAAVRMQAAASAHRFLRRIRSVRGRLR